ncbi:cell cycle checkpoint protein RAD17 [Tetranychus urticae]|uniref:Checkpoint protein RAD24-like helical bundle domain-containing protein n=1 Tax=Tetranychus urticae TaxID=32264 RepID=T1KDK6_TETUR|nr:cell cycle checkpoint protein RAD17 [Tetranychus urticae]
MEPPPSNSRKGFLDKFAGAFTCHSMSLKKDKKRPMVDGSPPESELCPTGFKKIMFDNQKGLPFVDILKPTSRSDLLVHPKKISEVDCWLTSIFGTRSSNPKLFLIVSGPSGSGKMTTLQLLARERGIKTIEFSEVSYVKEIFSVEDEKSYSYGEHLNNRSQSENVRNFLIQANVKSIVDKSPKNKKLLVFKDLPFTLVKEPEKYHKLWTWYYEKFSADGVPVVFILSNDPSREQIKIFSSQLRSRLNVVEIQFNPFVKTRIVKWLTDKLEKKVSKPDIEAIVDEGKGDFRNILNCFELKCSSSLAKQRSFTNFKRGAKKLKTDDNLSKDPGSSAIWGRDVSLELYHFLGKILFSKRHYDKPVQRTLPDELLKFERHPLVEDPFQLVETHDISSNTLNLFLHQNYLNHSENLESAANSIEWLSQSDCLRDDVYDGNSPLESYQKALSGAGLMFNLSPNGPVKVKYLDTRKAKDTHSKPSLISSNRPWHINQEKIKETKSTLKACINEKSKSLNYQDFILDFLPYASVMNISMKRFTGDLLKISCFPNISYGGFNKTHEPFVMRPSTVQLRCETSDIPINERDESDDEKLYFIEDVSD